MVFIKEGASIGKSEVWDYNKSSIKHLPVLRKNFTYVVYKDTKGYVEFCWSKTFWQSRTTIFKNHRKIQTIHKMFHHQIQNHITESSTDLHHGLWKYIFFFKHVNTYACQIKRSNNNTKNHNTCWNLVVEGIRIDVWAPSGFMRQYCPQVWEQLFEKLPPSLLIRWVC